MGEREPKLNCGSFSTLNKNDTLAYSIGIYCIMFCTHRSSGLGHKTVNANVSKLETRRHKLCNHQYINRSGNNIECYTVHQTKSNVLKEKTVQCSLVTNLSISTFQTVGTGFVFCRVFMLCCRWVQTGLAYIPRVCFNIIVIKLFALVPLKQPYSIWINISRQSAENYDHNTTNWFQI